MWKSRFYYYWICKFSKKIITVSEYSKKLLTDKYKAKKEKIFVVYCAADEFKAIEPDMSILNENPDINKNEYFLCVGSLVKNKNIKWCVDYAKKHQNAQFVIVGKKWNRETTPIELQDAHLLTNILFTGYVSDSQLVALIENCKAFVFPSYYEGFGMPPLEALLRGATIIVSNSSSLPEIYGESAIYIDPNNTDIDLDSLLSMKETFSKDILSKYSFEKSAKKLLSIMEDTI